MTWLASIGPAIFGALGKLFGWFTQRDAQRAARAESEAAYMKETLADVDKSNKARRRLRDDPDYARKLHDKYLRPD